MVSFALLLLLIAIYTAITNAQTCQFKNGVYFIYTVPVAAALADEACLAEGGVLVSVPQTASNANGVADMMAVCGVSTAYVSSSIGPPACSIGRRLPINSPIYYTQATVNNCLLSSFPVLCASQTIVTTSITDSTTIIETLPTVTVTDGQTSVISSVTETSVFITSSVLILSTLTTRNTQTRTTTITFSTQTFTITLQTSTVTTTESLVNSQTESRSLTETNTDTLTFSTMTTTTDTLTSLTTICPA